MQIDANVAEADIGGVAEGQNVNFTVDAYPDRTFHGEVTQVRNSPTTVNNVVTYDCGHRRDQRGLETETRHDGECLDHRRRTRKCVENSQWRAALPAAGNAVANR